MSCSGIWPLLSSKKDGVGGDPGAKVFSGGFRIQRPLGHDPQLFFHRIFSMPGSGGRRSRVNPVAGTRTRPPPLNACSEAPGEERVADYYEDPEEHNTQNQTPGDQLLLYREQRLILLYLCFLCLCHLKSPPSGTRSPRNGEMVKSFADRRNSFACTGPNARPPAGAPKVVATSPVGSARGRR
jgi:hypothetical protein